MTTVTVNEENNTVTITSEGIQGPPGLALTPDAGWSTSNVTTDRVINADLTSLNEVADVLATLIERLKVLGILAA